MGEAEHSWGSDVPGPWCRYVHCVGDLASERREITAFNGYTWTETLDLGATAGLTRGSGPWPARLVVQQSNGRPVMTPWFRLNSLLPSRRLRGMRETFSSLLMLSKNRSGWEEHSVTRRPLPSPKKRSGSTYR